MRFILSVIACIVTLSQVMAGTSNRLPHNKHVEKAGKLSDLSLTISLDSTHQINCLHSTGYAKVSAVGGTAPYAFLWSNGITGQVGHTLSAGVYSITVTDAAGATAQLGMQITENFDLPFVDAGGNIEVGCPNSVVTLNGNASAGSSFSYLWSASAGGNIASGSNSLSPVVDNAGIFTLVVTNMENGCTANETIQVKALDAGPSVVVAGGDLNCLHNSIVLQSSYSNNNTTINWTGPGNFTSSLPNPVVNIPGSYILTVTDTVTTCATSATAIVTSGPHATATGGGIVTCLQPTIALAGAGQPSNVNFAWTGPAGYSSNVQNPVVTNGGTYTLIVTQPGTGCTATSTVVVNANNAHPTVTAGSNGTITCGNTASSIYANITPAGNYNLLWSGPNNFNSTAASLSVFTPGVYTVTATNPANGCTASTTATVQSNTTAPGVTATGGALSCQTITTTIHSSSPTIGVIYAWKGPFNYASTLANPLVNTAGTYTVTVTNPNNGCMSTATVSVTQNVTVPPLNTTTGTVSCNTPSIKITATSTTSGVTFAWSGPNGFSSTVYNPSVTAGGVYTVTITNPVNGCINSNAVYVNENTSLPNVYAGTDRSLNCVFTSILMNPLGTSSGSGYSYQWSTADGNIVAGATSLYARADAPGIYKLTVKNIQNGCTASDEMTITQSEPVTAQAIALNPITCNGSANGSVKASGTGVGILSYIWSNGAPTATVNNLSAGLYTVTVTDEEGCTAVSNAALTEPTVVVANVATVAQSAAGVNNGSATASATGGTFPYTYKWNTGSTFMTINNLAPGTYTVTVTDQLGCSKVQSGTVNSISCFVVGSMVPTQITCSGAANGTATINLTGAVGTIHYAWSNGANTKTISSLTPGTYTVTATDANGCSVTLSTQITSPQALVFSVTNQTNIACVGQQTGSATVNASGGTTPYTFAWSNGTNGLTASNLNPGAYTCTVTDAKGCTQKQTAQIQLTDHNAPQLSLKNATVFIGTNGLATVTPNLFDNGSVDLECSIASWTVTPTSFDCEQIGTFTVTLKATDVNGNTATGTASVTIKDNIAPTMTCPANRTVAACGANATYTLPQITDNCQVFGAPTLVSGLASGATFPVGTTVQNYSFTDYGGNVATCSFSVTVLAPSDASVTSTPTNCSAACSGTATVTLTGSTGTAGYAWSNGQNTATATSLCQGVYTVTITDGAGCTLVRQTTVSAQNGSSAYAVSANINPASCTGSCDGQVNLIVSGGTSAPNVTWSNGLSGTSINGLCPGNYQAVLTDATGCSQTQQVAIDVYDQVAPTIICPNNIVNSNCQSVVTFNMPQVIDNCVVNLQQLQQTAGLLSGATFPEGNTVQTFRYTDGGGNPAECSFIVTINPAAAVVAMSTPVTCAGSCNGSAIISINSGQGPFNIQWSNGLTGPTATNLCAAAYSATITDGMGCTQTKSVTITQPDPLNIAVDQLVNDATGAGSGSITVAVTGGKAPYTYLWKRNGVFFAATEDINGLYAGQYALTVTDANGCSIASANLTITTPTVATAEPGAAIQMNVYPNPATDAAFIHLNGIDNESFMLQIMDMQGRILREENMESTSDRAVRVAISDLPDGMLVFRLTNKTYSVSKMVMKRG